MTAENDTQKRLFAARARAFVVRRGRSATILAGIVSLSGFLAAWGWPLELLCHFRVQYAVLFLSLALLMGALRNWRWAGVGVVLAAVNGWEVLPYYVSPPPRSGTPPRPLRVVSANLYSGNTEPELALEFLRGCDADVIALYEVTPAWAARLESALAEDYPHRRLHSQPGNFGIAMYSRLPFASATSHPLSRNNLAIEVSIMHEGNPVHVIAAHAYPPGGSRTALRDRQLKVLGEIAVSIPAPLIVVGDLNITPFSPPFRELCEASGLRDARRGEGIQPTWPAGRRLLAIPIDHALVSRHWEGYVRTGPKIGSDHLPLVLVAEGWW